MESGSATDFCLEDFISLWKEVQQVEDPAYLHLDRPVTPSPAPVEQAEQSHDLLALEDFLATAELVPYESSLEEEIFVDTLNDTEFVDFLMNRGQGTKRFASDPNESDLCPSPNKKKVADCQPTNFQDTCAATPSSATDDAASRRRKPDDTEAKPYIKKPPNAFMLFKAEQRQNVVDELHITNSARVNMVLGQRWKMMSDQEQAPYFDQARREKRAHEAKYPGWSPKDNYKKAKRRKAVKIPVPPNHHHFAFPANQQPVSENQKPYHEHSMKTIIINGISFHAIPLEAFFSQPHKN